MHEQIPAEVDARVDVRHQVLGERLEHDEPAVAADLRVLRVGVTLRSIACNTDPLGGTGSPVMNEHVDLAVGVALHQIGRDGREGYEPAVATDGRPEARLGPLPPAAGHAHDLGQTGEPVADEDVVDLVGVLGYEVGRQRVEGHEAPIGTHGRSVAVVVALHVCAAHADQFRDAWRGRCSRRHRCCHCRDEKSRRPCECRSRLTHRAPPESTQPDASDRVASATRAGGITARRAERIRAARLPFVTPRSHLHTARLCFLAPSCHAARGRERCRHSAPTQNHRCPSRRGAPKCAQSHRVLSHHPVYVAKPAAAGLRRVRQASC